MPISILMPALSPTMTEGNLARWLKAEGDAVSPGDVIAEIETDKATMEVESVDEGVLAKILIAEGAEEVPVNTPIAILLEDGEDAAALDGYDVDGTAPAPVAKEEAAAPATPEAAAPAPVATPIAAPAPAAAFGDRVVASPLARRLAVQQGIDLGQVTGSGPNGRIVKVDIENFSGAPAVSGVSAVTVSVEGDAPYEVLPLSNMRKVIAERMTESKQQVPHFYLTVECEIDRLLEARKNLNARAKDGEFKISVNDMIIKAAAAALIEVPRANAGWSDEGVRLYKRVDISVAVAIDDGLITPIVRGAEGKGLKAISFEMADLAARARNNRLTPEEFQGGTFTISNLGMYGLKQFDAVINQPQGAILAVGAGEQRPVVHDGELAVATVMSLTLSVDHRALDGAIGAQYLAALKSLIEEPLGLLL
jgi:pyruvate dehydrogenase E2 component (dihydrolipoamide acetyltransferase)